MHRWTVLALLGSLAFSRSAHAVEAEDIRRWLEPTTPGALTEMNRPIRAMPTVRRFYEGREFRPAWTGARSRERVADLLDALTTAEEHGLQSDDYHRNVLSQAFANHDEEAVELLATDAYLTLAAHLLGGRLDPLTTEPDWTAGRRERDLAVYLGAALDSGQIAASLAELEPNSPGYQSLKEALAMYRAATREGGWEPIPGGAAMKLGDTGSRVRELRNRLAATGLLNSDDAGSSERFDPDVETAVAAFQRRAGIEPDGIVGAVTLGQLNRTATNRVDQIRANLERWRWLPEDLGRRQIRVNIADFRLEARSDGKVERVHDVVVGRTYRKTPVFSAEMSFVVFNPWWDTPPSLARQDKLPAFQQDPGLVERLGFEVYDPAGNPIDASGIRWSDYSSRNFPFRLRQRPGPQNALGAVKMMFPNKHNVYLHDTPSQDLFRRWERAFSSGCVRVHDAVELSLWALAETPGWDRKRVETALASGKETRANLSGKIPVHIFYFTSVMEPDGSLRLINDVYDRDARLIAALNEPAPGLEDR